LITRIVEMFTTDGVATVATSERASLSSVSTSMLLAETRLLPGIRFMMPSCEDSTRPITIPMARTNRAAVYRVFLLIIAGITSDGDE